MRNKSGVYPHLSWLAPDKIIKDSLWSSISQASKYAKGKLLDIGCGKKPYLPIFKNRVESYVGLDLKGGDVCGSALALPFPNNSFETVFSSQVLEHVTDHFLMIREAYRVLKPNGYLIMTAPLFWCLHEEPNDYFRFTKYGLKLILEKAGFKIVEIKENGNWPSMVGQMTSLFLESTLNRTILYYPKKLLQLLVQYFYAKLSTLKRFTKNHQAPICYTLVAHKLSF